MSRTPFEQYAHERVTDEARWNFMRLMWEAFGLDGPDPGPYQPPTYGPHKRIPMGWALRLATKSEPEDDY